MKLVGVVVLAAALFAASASAQIEVLSTTSVGTGGGRTQLRGSGFFSYPFVTVLLDGDEECGDLRIQSDAVASCAVPAGAGRRDLFVAWMDSFGDGNNATFVDVFAYRAPRIAQTSYDATTSTLHLTGSYFGDNSTIIEVSLSKARSNADVVECIDVAFVAGSGYTELTCTPSVDLSQSDWIDSQYVVVLSVDGVTSTSELTASNSFTVGTCYALGGVSNERVDAALYKRAVEKSRARLMNLRDHLAEIRSLLPPYDDNTCCSSTYHYPVPEAAMLNFAQMTLRFQGCFDDRCEDGEGFLSMIAP